MLLAALMTPNFQYWIIHDDEIISETDNRIYCDAFLARCRVLATTPLKSTLDNHPKCHWHHTSFCHEGFTTCHLALQRLNKYYGGTEHKPLLRKASLNLKSYRTPLIIGIDRYWRAVESDLRQPSGSLQVRRSVLIPRYLSDQS